MGLVVTILDQYISKGNSPEDYLRAKEFIKKACDLKVAVSCEMYNKIKDLF